MLVEKYYRFSKLVKFLIFTFTFGVLIYFLGEITILFIQSRDLFLEVWNSESINPQNLTSEQLAFILFLNGLILIYFVINLLRSLFRGFFYKNKSVIFTHNRIQNSSPIVWSIFSLILAGVQGIIILDLLLKVSVADIPIFGYNITIDIDRTPLPNYLIILGNIIFTIFLAVYLFRYHINRWIRHKTYYDIYDEILSPAEVHEIINFSDPVIRNLKITQAYHDLSVGMAFVLGNRNVSWSIFATWASKTAGLSIRKEEIPSFVKRLADVSKVEGIFSKVYDPEDEETGEDIELKAWDIYVYAVVRDISNSIAFGNLKVFEELAPIFSKFILLFHYEKKYDQELLEQFQANFKPGSTADEGQDLLKEAYTGYYNAIFEKNQKRKAEIILLSNIKIGLHEQIRLQPFIESAVTAPLRHGFKDAFAEKLSSSIPLIGSKVTDRVMTRLNQNELILEEMCKEIVTSIMKMVLPGRIINLSKDAPRMSRFHEFPADLHSIELPELMEIINRYDKDISTIKGSGATDWVNLENRLGFIIDLFRAQQQNKELFASPFTASQTKKIYKGELPSGKL